MYFTNKEDVEGKILDHISNINKMLENMLNTEKKAMLMQAKSTALLALAEMSKNDK